MAAAAALAPFKPSSVLTPKQLEQQRLIAGAATHNLDYGGARGGKTFGFVHPIVNRAIMADNSRHLIARFRFNAVKRSVRLDTLPKVFSLAFPGCSWRARDQDGYLVLPNGSEIWYAGLDSQERIDKILGSEFATIFVNEASEVTYEAILTLRTRLAQRALLTKGKNIGQPLRRKMFYDLNPTTRKHWSYQEFVLKVSPATGEPLRNPDDYGFIRTSPHDNAANLDPEYIASLADMPRLQRKRFYEGDYIAEVDGALWRQNSFRRCSRAAVPELKRIVIGVDPSGSTANGGLKKPTFKNDEIGIVVAGLGFDGRAYVLEDLSLHTGPNAWAGMVAAAYRRHDADCVRYENNYGGEMGVALIKTVDKTINVKSRGTGARGKHVRAEPVAALYDQGKVTHVGAADDFEDLEDQLMQFSVEGYMGPKSPDRGDALVWALTELMLGGGGPAAASAVSANG